MVAFLRRFLVVLLVLLQYAAPLVHAHASGNNSQRGLHLHEFESLRLVTDGLAMHASDNGAEIENGIIEIGSAIKQHQNIDQVAAFFLSDNTLSFVIARDAEIINFSPQTVEPITQPFLWHHSSRAPPALKSKFGNSCP